MKGSYVNVVIDITSKPFIKPDFPSSGLLCIHVLKLLFPFNLGFRFKNIFCFFFFFSFCFGFSPSFLKVMEDDQVGGQEAKEPNSPNSTIGSSERSEPVRSRWIPKPEQILILESIFNSGMVNPPKEETVRIRKLLEKFGSVGDANVFYWFQNRRSRSRRRQRQLQASLEQRNQAAPAQQVGGAIQYENSTSSAPAAAGAATMAFGASSPSTFGSNYDLVAGSSSSCCVLGAEDDHFFSVSGQMGFPEIEHSSSGVTSVLGPSDASNLHFQSGKSMPKIIGRPFQIQFHVFFLSLVYHKFFNPTLTYHNYNAVSV